MEAKELRLGNYVKFPNNEKHLTVNHRIIHDFFMGITIYDPIPLTEEWLLKYGFVNSDYDGEKYNPESEYADQFKYILKSGVFRRDFVCFPIKGWIVNLGDYESEIEIKYVHEMQNALHTLSQK